jgi:gliding motility-associated-like protein
MKKNYILLLLLILAPFAGLASHIRAGEITATRLPGSQLTYRITLVTYTDEINGKAANDQQNSVDFNLGFSTNRVEKLTVSRKSRVMINQATARNVYDTTYTFPSAGYYTIGVSIINRNDNTVNLPAPDGSQSISFYVQTSILINANVGFNSTPLLLNIPLDSAALGQRFIHNPGAFDIDGDSLSYKLTIPRKAQVAAGTGATTGLGVFIPEYLEPNTVGPSPVLNQAGTGPATFTIDAKTGDLIWDVPRQAGQYNVAFVIEEWRKGFDGGYLKIGEIVRDMQIIVVETDNKAPVLTLPPDLCVEAGETLEFEVTAQDENISQQLKLTSSGGVYNVDPAGVPTQYIDPLPAKFNSTPAVGKVSGKFVWETNCLHARDQVYNVVFKVEDNPGRFNTSLVDLKTLNIRVLPPRPKALVAEAVGNGNRLSWTPLTACNENGKILIYRKNGCSGLNPQVCSPGMPASWGYTLIGEVSTKESSFLDSNAPEGEIYSYRLITQIAENAFINIQSAPSTEFCIGSEVKPATSVMTKVSVSETSPTNGKIDVKWSLPVNIDLQTLPAERVYKLYRAEGIGGENFTLIHTKTTAFTDTTDLKFTDQNLNTAQKVYRYKVEFYTNGSTLRATSLPASSVFLTATTADQAVPLRWESNTPWSNENKAHYIFRREEGGTYNRIAKVEVTDVNTFVYTDRGEDTEKGDGDVSTVLMNGDTYCYRVLTQGEYEAFKELGILSNFSQERCVTPQDQSPPCTPVLTGATTIQCGDLKPEDFCSENTFSNVITWTNPEDSEGKPCRTDIVSYNIYFSRYELREPTLLANVQASGLNTFTHRKNSTEGFAGCYTIEAVNSLGLKSGVSNKICFDNCETLNFPNAFSPNGDGKNDTFTPMNCPAFIKSATMEIYGAHGQKIRTVTGEALEWDGKDNSGKEVAAGTYYYVVTVDFERLDPAGSQKTYKGYVTLIKR